MSEFDENIQDKSDSIRVSKTAKGTATWDIKIRSKDLTDDTEKEKVVKRIKEIWNNLTTQFP